MSESQSRFRTLCVLCFSLAVAGCGRQTVDYEFVFTEKTESLMPEARDGFDEVPGIKQMVTERFGQPENLVVTDDLPIDFGGIEGEVTSVPEQSESEITVILKLDDQYVPKVGQPPVQLRVTSGDAKGRTFQVTSWNADKQMATLAAPDISPTQQESADSSSETVRAGEPKDAISAEDRGTVANLAEGDSVVFNDATILRSGHTLYMQHCSHCHGTTGDGMGPTARYLNPRPRDFRHGLIKFTSTSDRAKPSRDDFLRILKNGIPGTYMPSFVPSLNEEKLHAVVEYVRFLSMRGEYERSLTIETAVDYSQKMLAERLEDGETKEEILEELKEFMEEDLADISDDAMDDLVDDWEEAEDEELVPEIPRIADTIESRQIGRQLYLSKSLNCADCHGISGEGNGPQSRIFEKNPETQELYPEEGLHDVWHNVNQPRNLTQGIYRGGRRPVDLYRRLHAGIKGTRMPSFKSLPPEELWHLVNYVLSVPFEVDPGAPEMAAADQSTEEAQAASVDSVGE